MRRLVPLAVFVLGCSRAITQPTPDLRFDLSNIDGQALPRTPIGWPADQAVQAASLDFPGVPVLADGAQGLVTYSIGIAGQDYAEPLRYQVAGTQLAKELVCRRSSWAWARKRDAEGVGFSLRRARDRLRH